MIERNWGDIWQVSLNRFDALVIVGLPRALVIHCPINVFLKADFIMMTYMQLIYHDWSGSQITM